MYSVSLFFILSAWRAYQPLPNVIVVRRPLSSFPLVVCRLILPCHRPPPLSLFATVVVRCRHPPCPPLPLLSAAAIFCCHIHHCHSTVSAFSCRPLLSFPIVVHRPISHAIIFCRYRCPPLPSLFAAPVFHCHSHHHHSAVSAISHCPLSSFPIAVRRPISRVVVIRQRHHPPPSSSTVAIPPLVLTPTLKC